MRESTVTLSPIPGNGAGTNAPLPGPGKRNPKLSPVEQLAARYKLRAPRNYAEEITNLQLMGLYQDDPEAESAYHAAREKWGELPDHDPTPPPAAQPKQDAGQGEPVYCTVASVEPEEVYWLSPGRIPLGKLTVVEGDPGLGKTMAMLDLAARVSRGIGFPGDPDSDPAAVVFLTGEDGIADTIRPRLEAAGGDLNRIFVYNGTRFGEQVVPVVLPDHEPTLRALVEETSARLVIIDPLNSFLSGSVDAHRDHDVRRALLPLKMMAEDLGVAVVVVRHLRKGGGRAIAAGGGSIAFGAAARSVLLVDRDPNDAERRILASVKCSVAAAVKSLAFRIAATGSGAPRIQWLGTSEETSDTLTAARAVREGDDTRTKVEEATDLLREWLTPGEMERVEVLKLGRQAGLSDRTLQRAAKELGVKQERRGLGREHRSYWALPPTEPLPAPGENSVGASGGLGASGDFQALSPPAEAPLSYSRQTSALGLSGASGASGGPSTPPQATEQALGDLGRFLAHPAETCAVHRVPLRQLPQGDAYRCPVCAAHLFPHREAV